MFRRTPQPRVAPEIDAAPVAFVLFDGSGPKSLAMVKQVFDPLVHGAQHMSPLTVHDDDYPYAMGVVGDSVPLVIQWPEAPFPAERYPESTERGASLIDGHSNHMAVLSPITDSGVSAPVKLLHAVSVVLAAQAIALTTKCRSIYWRSSDEHYSPHHWTRGCNGYLRDALFPIDQIIRFVENTDQGKNYISSIGMSLFDQREIEVWDSARPMTELRDLMTDAILDSIAAGEICGRGKSWQWKTEPAAFRTAKKRSVLAHGQRVNVLYER